MSTIPLVPADVEQILEANDSKMVPPPTDVLGGTGPRDEAAGCPTGMDSAPAATPKKENAPAAKTKKPGH